MVSDSILFPCFAWEHIQIFESTEKNEIRVKVEYGLLHVQRSNQRTS